MEILCGQCGKTLQVEDSAAGAPVRCPHCSRQIQAPPIGGAAAGRPIAPAAGQRAGPPGDEQSIGFAEQAKAAMERKTRIVCGNCAKGLIVPTRLAGKQTQCPACGSVIQIPAQDEEAEILERLSRSPQTPPEESLLTPPRGDLPQRAAPESPAAPDDNIVLDETVPPPTAPLPHLKSRRRAHAALVAAIIVIVASAIVAAVIYLSQADRQAPPAPNTPATLPSEAPEPIPTEPPTDLSRRT